MNSLQKQATASGNSPDEYVVSFEKNLATMTSFTDVDLLMRKLQFLGNNFDPFGNEVTGECQQIMDNMGLTIH
jgi:hypothetical protein